MQQQPNNTIVEEENEEEDTPRSESYNNALLERMKVILCSQKSSCLDEESIESIKLGKTVSYLEQANSY
jgi:hypothetical protein